MATRNFCDRPGCEKEIRDGQPYWAVEIERLYSGEGLNSAAYQLGGTGDDKYESIEQVGQLDMICSECAREIARVIRRKIRLST